MAKRFIVIWFRFLLTDWFIIRRPELDKLPFVLASPDHGRMVVTAANTLAENLGVIKGMVVADARAFIPGLEVIDDPPGQSEKLLKRIADWCSCFSPVVAIDLQDGLILDVTGCAHLWGGESEYLTEIHKRFGSRGYRIRAGMADTIGAAWAVSRFGKKLLIESGSSAEALLTLPPAALRIEPQVLERLFKLGLREVKDFLRMPRASLRRRFGQGLLDRLDQAMGYKAEFMKSVKPIEPYQERLPCMEPIVSAIGIEIAIEHLLQALCERLKKEGKGLRVALLKCFRVDGEIIEIGISTNRPSANRKHLARLFETKIGTIEPALGIELFMLEAPKVEDQDPIQERIWDTSCGLDHPDLSELLDRLSGRIGSSAIRRYLPDEHYWPERSVKNAHSLNETSTTAWTLDRPRPLQLFTKPEPVEVTAPIPDYPPMLFRYKGQIHKIIKADGPERIEQEWWLQEGQHRDYYAVEDEEGRRYWLFRSGHYSGETSYQWFLHGFFA